MKLIRNIRLCALHAEGMSFVLSQRIAVLAFITALALSQTAFSAQADEAGSLSAPAIAEPAIEEIQTPTNTAAHLQFTNVTQRHPRINSPYVGTNSLSAVGRTEETTDITLYLGARLWRGAEIWANPEVDQGFGFDKTVGIAGFPNGEAYKIGANAPYLRVPRLFIRQTLELGGEHQYIEPLANQMGGPTTTDNLTVTVGKFAMTDVFDTNRFAHDARNDFLNWSVLDAGAFDYAADSWGFTYGVSAELNLGPWTTRAGIFQLSKVPNGKVVAVDFQQLSYVAEVERRHDWFGLQGSVKLLGFVNRGRMGRYTEAVALAQGSNVGADITLVRRKASRPGFAINIEQDLAPGVGMFARVSANDGSKEAYEFTEINRSISAGLSLKGSPWRRDDDVLGAAAVVNQLSRSARSYFQAGGMGILIGDGNLNYGNEAILEAYYAVRLNRFTRFSIDYQHVSNPAYNRDRGPVSVYSARLHLER